MSSTSALYISCTTTTVVDNAFWETAVPEPLTPTAQSTLTSRLRTMQNMMASRYLTASSLRSQVTVEGKLYLLEVTRAT